MRLGFAINTKLRSIDIERFTPKFLKNWETKLFQKLAGIGSRCLIPICIPMNANWYYFTIVGSTDCCFCLVCKKWTEFADFKKKLQDRVGNEVSNSQLGNS